MSHPPTPQPRPALRKAPDGSVHPASPVLSSLAVEVPADGAGARSTSPASADPSAARPSKKPKKGKGKKAAKPEPAEVVTLQVELPKSVRKALRKRAADYGWTAEEASAHVLRVWADEHR